MFDFQTYSPDSIRFIHFWQNSFSSTFSDVEFETLRNLINTNSSFQINLKYSKNITIINDAYNASPGSMLLSLNNFKSVKNKKIILVLGDMYELGSKSIFYHRKLIPIIKKTNPKTLITVGNFSKVLTDYFKDQFTCKNYLKLLPIL